MNKHLGIICYFTLVSFSISAQEGITPKPLGQLINVGGWNIHFNSTGISNSGPTVILESGSGDFSFDWNLVQSKVEQFANVVSYDRAGNTWSDLGPQPRTMKQMCYELNTGLEKMGILGPYILVGHSSGGLLVRVFAKEYPNKVKGIVLVDPTSDDSELSIMGKIVRVRNTSKKRAIPPIKKIITEKEKLLPDSIKLEIEDFLKSFGKPVIEYPYTLLPDNIQKLRLWALSRAEHYEADNDPYWGEEFQELYDYRKANKNSLKGKPLIIIISGNDKSKLGKKKIKQKIELKKMSTNNKTVIDRKSGHHIQLENPDLVVKSIKEVIEDNL